MSGMASDDDPGGSSLGPGGTSPGATLSPAGDPAGWDCQACGACCRNLDSNLASGVRYWVEISPSDKILTRPDLVRKLVTHDRNRVPHLRMSQEGSCEALRGTIGAKVTCSIYHQRPSPCRRVMPGDESCLRSRAALGLPV
jgi:uncharacterized protein